MFNIAVFIHLESLQAGGLLTTLGTKVLLCKVFTSVRITLQLLSRCLHCLLDGDSVIEKVLMTVVVVVYAYAYVYTRRDMPSLGAIAVSYRKHNLPVQCCI